MYIIVLQKLNILCILANFGNFFAVHGYISSKGSS